MLVFDWRHSVDKNTMFVRLQFSTGMPFIFRVLRWYGQYLISWQVLVHKLQEDIHEDSTQDSTQNSWIPCNRSDGSLKASGRSQVSRSFCQWIRLDDRFNTVQTLGQAFCDLQEVGFPLKTLFGKVFFNRPDISTTRSDVTLLREEISCFGKAVAEDCPNART
jgi:hypothetical protein